MHLFDANTFMEASRTYYSFSFAPGFWEWLVSDEMRSEIASVEAVLDEINKGEGPLVDWAENDVPDDFWLTDTEESIEAAQRLAAWATDPARIFKQSAVDEFLDSADFELIAQAMAIGATVVTRETSEPNCKKRVKIPDACIAMGVACVQPFEVYGSLGLKFQ